MKKTLERAGAYALSGLLVTMVFTMNLAGDTLPMKETENQPAVMDNPENLSDAQWRERLGEEQYRILRQAGTERPFGAVYEQFKKQGSGDYYCAGCGTRLFSSDHKFDSHCGWPSFWDPASIEAVKLHEDNSFGMKRVEVVCANCGGHLGHVFEGEGFDTPTDQRYCINGSVLVFVPEGEAPPSPQQDPEPKS